MYNIFKYFATSFIKWKNVDKCLIKMQITTNTQ
jgi:hypothetical protein